MIDIPKDKSEANLIYKDTGTKKIELTFLPPINQKYESAAVYFVISGGGWHTESKEGMLDFSKISVQALREEGFAVVSIDYRVCGDGVCMREIISDCFDAALYIAHFADILGIDKNNFILSGHSAGAHLALMLGYAPRSAFNDGYEYDDEFTVRAVAAMSPPTELYDSNTHNLHDLYELFSGNDTREEREYTSPVSYVNKNTPPTLLCAGTSDFIVFSISSERLYKKLMENGADAELLLSVCGGHCFEKIHEGIEPSISMEEIQERIVNFVKNRIEK